MGDYPFPAVSRRRTIETNGASIHVRVGGHGRQWYLHATASAQRATCGGSSWRARSSKDNTIIVPDLRGRGSRLGLMAGYDKKNQAADGWACLDARVCVTLNW